VVEISSFTTCSDQLVATNIPQHLEHSGVVRAFGGSNGLLCIERDNSPSRGTFYQGTGSKSPSQVEAAWQVERSFEPTLSADEANHRLTRWHKALNRARDWATA
jgi:hypothetical protein